MFACAAFAHRGTLFWKAMPRKRKIKPFRVVKAVKAAAREKIGAPPATRLVPDRKKKEERHKATLGKLLAEE
jgi:hypothetical protein